MRAWRWLAGLLAGLMVVFLALPPLVLLLRGVSVEAWRGLPETERILSAVMLSLVTTLVSLMLIALMGTPLAYGLARGRFAGRRILSVLVALPIVMPPAVAGLALLLVFGRRGVLGEALLNLGITLPFSAAAVVMAQVFVAAPFYIRAAQVGFASVPPDIEDAARVDGAESLEVARYVTLPLAGRALTAGLILSWARALGEFGATILFAGNLSGATQTMPLLVYSVFERDLDAAIWTALILVGLALLALLTAQWLTRGDPLR